MVQLSISARIPLRLSSLDRRSSPSCSASRTTTEHSAFLCQGQNAHTTSSILFCYFFPQLEECSGSFRQRRGQHQTAGCLAWHAQTAGITVRRLAFWNSGPGLIHYMSTLKGRRSFSSSSARKADITLTVDGKEVAVPQGATPVLQHVPTPIYGLPYRLCLDSSL